MLKQIMFGGGSFSEKMVQVGCLELAWCAVEDGHLYVGQCTLRPGLAEHLLLGACTAQPSSIAHAQPPCLSGHRCHGLNKLSTLCMRMQLQVSLPMMYKCVALVVA